MASTFPEWIYDGSDIPDPEGRGERAVDFLRRLKHPKSRLPGKAFQLDPWQERIIRRIYGPRNPDGTRIVKTVVLLLPRGNRKTSLSAALALLHTIGPERVPGGEAIFAAADRKQAGIGFREAVGIIRADRRVNAAVRVYDAFNAAKQILYPTDDVRLETISSEAGTAHGKTPAFVLADELHIWPNKYLWEALSSGLDKSDNPLLVVATTAGRGQENVAWEVVEDARKVARGESEDPSILPILFEADRDADWRDEAVWRHVNPGLAHGYPSLDGFRRHARRAERSASERESFRQLKLNVWLDHSADPFVDMAIFDEGGTPAKGRDDFEAAIGLPALVASKAPCWIGVDMSTTIDLTAVVAAFPDGDGGFIVLPHAFCPAANVQARADRDKVPYPRWAEQGFITPTPGNVIDPPSVESYIRGLCDRFDVREINFDEKFAQSVMGPLGESGLPVASMQQGWVTQSPALNVLEAAIVGRKFRHGGHPVLRWCFDNVAIQKDGRENRTMHKGKSTDRIDLVIATWMAVSRAASGASNRSFLDDPTIRAEDLVW